MTLRAGTSGWSYAPWRPAFYPAGSKAGDWLGYYAAHLPTVEINNSFYRPPSDAMVARWRDAVPPGFKFAVKVWQEITHIRKLRDCAEPLGHFMQTAAGFGETLGPLLFQLPPSLARDDGLLENFLTLLPETWRFAVEFRHASWFDASIYRLLARYNVALCHGHLKQWQTPAIRTAPFLYVRLHGPLRAYQGRYSQDFIGELAEWIAETQTDAYVYFNNTMGEPVAVEQSLELMHRARDFLKDTV